MDALRAGWCRWPFSFEAGRVDGMSTKAEAVLEEIKALPPEEQREVCDGIRELEARRRNRAQVA